MQLLVQCRPNYLGCILSCSLLFWVTESRREILHNTCITINTANSLAFLTHKSLLFFHCQMDFLYPASPFHHGFAVGSALSAHKEQS